MGQFLLFKDGLWLTTLSYVVRVFSVIKSYKVIRLWNYHEENLGLRHKNLYCYMGDFHSYVCTSLVLVSNRNHMFFFLCIVINTNLTCYSIGKWTHYLYHYRWIYLLCTFDSQPAIYIYIVFSNLWLQGLFVLSQCVCFLFSFVFFRFTATWCLDYSIFLLSSLWLCP